MVRFGVPGQNKDTLSYVDNRLATVPAVQAPRRPLTTDKKFPLWCEWRVNKDAVLPAVEGEFWKLVRFESNGDATWQMFSTGTSGPMTQLRTDDGNIVVPDGTGTIDADGIIVANATNATPLFTDGATANTARWELQVGAAITGAPADTNDAGIVSFDDTQFTVDVNGFVQLAGGGLALDQIGVDFNTAPGTDPVVPSATGNIDISGSTVANATNLNAPVATHSRAVNAFNIEIQVAAAVAASPADVFDAGLASFDNNVFTVDANGFVTLVGGSGPALQAVDVQFSTAPGNNPVSPDASGLINIDGAVVANGTNASEPVATHSRALNSFNIEVQRSTAVAASDSDSNGLCHFNNANFTVDANGFVDLNTITPSQFSNLGISYDAGTGVFSITSADGTALSASNPGSVTMNSKANPGTLLVFSITTPYSFIDDNGASQIIGNLFGLTTGIATDQDIPFLIYFVMNDAETAVTPMISRSPFSTFSPSAATIGKPSSAVADNNLAFWALDDSITVGDYDLNPVLRVGLFRMRMSAADDWTVQTITYSSGNLDGMNVDIPNRNWDMPTGQFGAAAGRLMRNNGGTTPEWLTQRIVYQFVEGQTVLVRYQFVSDGGTDGAGAVAAQMITPFNALTVIGSGANVFVGSFLIDTPSVTLRMGIHSLSHNDNICTFFDYAGATITNSLFPNGARNLRGQFYYRVGGT